MSFLKYYVFIGLLVVFNSCQNQPKQLSFYYWNTTFHIDSFSNQKIKNLGTKKIYLHCFDVVLNNQLNPEPVGVLLFKEKPSKNYKYQPVIFIKKEVFERTFAIESNHELALKILRLLNGAMKEAELTYQEIQIDCDWTANTKAIYFDFLQQIKELSKKKIIITLRLHQLKYTLSSGIPPANEAILMCYNMGNILNYQNTNSILDFNTLKAYTEKAKKYPIPLTIALPIFNWQLLYNDHELAGILPFINTDSLVKAHLIKPLNQFDFICTQNFIYKNINFLNSAIIKNEQVDAETLIKVKKYLFQLSQPFHNEVILYNLDAKNITHFSDEFYQKLKN